MNRARWIFFPDYRAGNPYQALLGNALSAAFDVRGGTVSDALEAAHDPGTVFHLHWEDAVFAAAPNVGDAAARIGIFLTELDALRDCGVRCLWTVHNAAPHEDRFPELTTAFRRALVRRMDLIHVHSPTAAALLAEIGAPRHRIMTMPHPNFRGAYPDDITDAAARRHFGFDPAATVFAFLGAMRPYKGLETLVSAFREVHRACPAARLILAGRVSGMPDARLGADLAAIRLLPGFVDDRAVQYVLRAADYGVFPYRQILTSGAMMLALGFARPVIVPSHPALLDVVRPGEDAWTYRPGDQDDLAKVLLSACAATSDQREAMRRHARRTADSMTFAHLGKALLEWALAVPREASGRLVADPIPEETAA